MRRDAVQNCGFGVEGSSPVCHRRGRARSARFPFLVGRSYLAVTGTMSMDLKLMVKVESQQQSYCEGKNKDRTLAI
jgi:hypothetical protein